jgi:hypothetical protein
VIGRVLAFAEFAAACVAAVGAAMCWLNARQVVAVAPIAEGQPATSSVVYSPQLLLLTMLLAMTAGVLAVVGGATLRRSRLARSVTQADFLISGSMS